MNNLKIWLIPGLVVILALAGLVYFRGRLPEEITTEKPAEVTTEVRVKPKGFAKPVEPSPQVKAAEDADAMVEALDTGDVSDCGNITWSEETRKQCEDNINYALFLKSGDATQCERLHNEDLKLECYNRIYLSLAIDQRNISLCDKISDPTLKQMCLDQLQMILSRYAKSADDCSVIASETLRQQCEDNFFLKSSAETLSIESCDNITDSDLANQCKKTVTKNIEVVEQSKQAAANATVTKTLQEVLVLCDKLTGGRATTCKDSIYPQLAFDEKDLGYCDKMSTESKTDECQKEQGERLNEYYLRQALASRDKTFCNKISDNQLQQLCLSS